MLFTNIVFFRNRRRGQGMLAFVDDVDPLLHSSTFDYFFGSAGGESGSDSALLANDENGMSEAVGGGGGAAESEQEKQRNLQEEREKINVRLRNREQEKKWADIKKQKETEKTENERVKEHYKALLNSKKILKQKNVQGFALRERSQSATPLMKSLMEEDDDDITAIDGPITSQPKSCSTIVNVVKTCSGTM